MKLYYVLNKLITASVALLLIYIPAQRSFSRMLSMFGFKSINAIRRVPLTRAMSSKESFTELTIDREGIAIISLNRPPVNSINLEMLQEINRNIDVVQKNECKGLVFTSSLKLFSAGLDLSELYKPNPMRLLMFYTTLQDTFLKIYGSGETTTTVAVNGYTAAGGCVLSLLCDYRVMVNDTKAKIGLNDTMVGIVPRPWICDILTQIMGYRQAEIAVTASTMYTAEEALKVNLVDELANNKEDAIEKCKQFIRRYDDIPIKIKAQTKRNLRAAMIQLVEDRYNREEDMKLCCEAILDPHVQGLIEKFTQQLKKK